MIYVKQFGLQRSSTNTVKALLEINFVQVHVLAGYAGNKHHATDWATMAAQVQQDDPADFGLSTQAAEQIAGQIAQRTLPVIINIKEPVSWVNNYYRYSYKKALSKNPHSTFAFDRHFVEKVLPNWEANVLSWLAFHDQHPRSLVFVHEEVVAGFDQQLALIRERFGLQPAERYPTGRLDGYARRGIETQHGDELIVPRMAFDRDYHLAGRWLQDIPPELREPLFAYRADVLRRHPRLATLFGRVSMFSADGSEAQ